MTLRPREIPHLPGEGKSAKEIGTVLHVSTTTIESHKYGGMGKLSITTNVDLVRLTIRQGIVSIQPAHVAIFSQNTYFY